MRRKREVSKIMARVPEDQRVWLEQQAERNFTSMNAELVRAVRFRMDAERQPEKAAVG